MGAPVRIDDEAFSDERYEDLALLAGLADADHARGKMARLWRQCTLEQSHALPVVTVLRILGPRGVIALIGARLGESLDENTVRIRGTDGRIEWLQKLRDNAKFGKMGGRPRNPSKPTRVPKPKPMETPLTLTLALTPTLPERERDLPLPAAQEIEVSRSPEASLEPELQRTAELVKASGEARKRLWQKLNETRQAIASELGVEARPLHFQDPGERELGCRLRESESVDVGEANAEHVLAIAAAEARTTKSVQWLTGAVFGDRSWRRALGMTVDDAKRPRAGPRTLAAVDSTPPRRLKRL